MTDAMSVTAVVRGPDAKQNPEPGIRGILVVFLSLLQSVLLSESKRLSCVSIYLHSCWGLCHFSGLLCQCWGWPRSHEQWWGCVLTAERGRMRLFHDWLNWAVHCTICSSLYRAAKHLGLPHDSCCLLLPLANSNPAAKWDNQNIVTRWARKRCGFHFWH